MNINVKELATKLASGREGFKDVFFVACGGSLNDLYPGYYFLRTESKTMRAQWITAREIMETTPACLDENSLVILCSHGGNTWETVTAGKIAKEKGAAIFSMTHTPGSICDGEFEVSVVYPWEENTNEKDRPQGLVLGLLNELMMKQEPGYALYDMINDGLEKADGIVRNAIKKQTNASWVFAELYAKEKFLYVLGSGAAYAAAYGFAICSLQEMQWIDCCYLNSAEYFHGPFECTDEDHLYILLKNVGRTRTIDERVESFLNKYGKKYEIIDGATLGLDAIDPRVMEYFSPMVFYAMSVVYRNALANKKGHPTDMRRYMGVVKY